MGSRDLRRRRVEPRDELQGLVKPAPQSRVYLDNAATTPLRPEALEAMLPFLRGDYANPSSPHTPGQYVRRALDAARRTTAAALGARPSEIIYTSGGSEADCLAIFGIMDAHHGRHFITAASEHHAVLHAAEALRARGTRVTILPVDREGFVSPEALRAALTDDATLVSLMHANNEIGTLAPIRELAAIARERGAFFHTDAVQTVGHIAVDVKELGVDALSISGHKFEGPKGIGALYVREGVKVSPLIYGGGQEDGRRAGTENAPGIVGMSVALDLAAREIGETAPRTAALRDRLIGGVLSALPGSALNGSRHRRLPNNASLRFDDIEGQTLVIGLTLAGFDASTGSACTSGSLEPSHVLEAIGLDPVAARSTVRFSLGRATEEADIARLLAALPGMIHKLRALSGELVGGRPQAAQEGVRSP